MLFVQYERNARCALASQHGCDVWKPGVLLWLICPMCTQSLPGWCEEVLRLLRDSGYLDDTLRSWGLTETEIAAVYASIEETLTDALTP